MSANYTAGDEVRSPMVTRCSHSSDSLHMYPAALQLCWMNRGLGAGENTEELQHERTPTALLQLRVA